MSRHEGVSCDSCLKGNFRGKRYKCLICYDYDLCSTCYEAGATTTRHTTEHPMQCILTRTDFDLYYGGEALTTEQPQSFTCPYCGKMGFPEATLHDHVTSEHADASVEVVCPVCAALPGGDPNHVTDDFASHLTLEHRTPRDFDEPAGMRHVRRIPHPGRGVSGSRTRRANMHFASTGTALTGLSPSGRETMDPIAELLSQLSSVRSRAAAAQSVSSQLQQLEMQLQSTRNSQQISSWCYNRQQLERLPRRQAEAAKVALPSNAQNSSADQGGSSGGSSQSNSLYLLVKCSDELSESEQKAEMERSDRSMFVQELLLSTLTDQIQVQGDSDDPSALLEALKSPSSEEVQSESKACDDRKPSGPAQSKPVMPCVAPTTTKSAESRQTSSPAPSSSQRSSGSGSGAAASSRQHVGGTSNQGGGGGTRQVYNSLSNPTAVSPSVSSSSSASGSSMLQIPARASGHSRDPRINPAAAKRNLLKHMPPPRASDTEPPH
ncbi:E3 ubiquitin-protein ligase KCMF1-like isoform X1 [Haliotis asinina]|uniref:E3 ubiquitin-protein ligase KCMF1-like isoform X1 n=1 Tax=Haliotis asinina TaxID=109174 RepID=UPI003531D903